MKKITFKQKLYNFWNNEKFRKVRDIILFVSLGINLLIFILFGVVSCSIKDDKTSVDHTNEPQTQLIKTRKEAFNKTVPGYIPQYYTLDFYYNGDEWNIQSISDTNLSYNLASLSQYNLLIDYSTNGGFNHNYSRFEQIIVNIHSPIQYDDYFYIELANGQWFNYRFRNNQWGYTHNSNYSIHYIDFDTSVGASNLLEQLLYNLLPDNEYELYVYNREYSLSDLYWINLVNCDSNGIFDILDFASIQNGSLNINDEFIPYDEDNRALYIDSSGSYYIESANYTFEVYDDSISQYYLDKNDNIKQLQVNNSNRLPSYFTQCRYNLVNVQTNSFIGTFNLQYVKDYTGTFYELTNDIPNYFNGTFNKPISMVSSSLYGRVLLNCYHMNIFPNSPNQVYEGGQGIYNLFKICNKMKYGQFENVGTSGNTTSGFLPSDNGTGLNNVFSLLTLSFGGLASLLNIELMPAITLGALLFVPLVVTIIIAVIKLVRK